MFSRYQQIYENDKNILDRHIVKINKSLQWWHDFTLAVTSIENHQVEPEDIDTITNFLKAWLSGTIVVKSKYFAGPICCD